MERSGMNGWERVGVRVYKRYLYFNMNTQRKIDELCKRIKKKMNKWRKICLGVIER
jgi:hypothetical protein